MSEGLSNVKSDSASKESVSDNGSEEGDDISEEKPRSPSKRRRVARACDECRLKKVKCDGNRPCLHCTTYGYECLYKTPSLRRRNPPPECVRRIETRLERATTIINRLIPDADIDDIDVDGLLPIGSHGAQSVLREQNRDSTSEQISQALRTAEFVDTLADPRLELMDGRNTFDRPNQLPNPYDLPMMNMEEQNSALQDMSMQSLTGYQHFGVDNVQTGNEYMASDAVNDNSKFFLGNPRASHPVGRRHGN